MEPAYLIVNADDYGYSPGVSRGILDAAESGLITATGVMANSPNFAGHVKLLKSAGHLDVGVHLNLTWGEPLTDAMSQRGPLLRKPFPGKYSLALDLLTRRLPVKYIVEEWRAQIGRCVDAGIVPIFLNTHEHLHALPLLFSAILRLAEEYNIPYVRYPAPEWLGWSGVGGMVRNVLLQAAHIMNRSNMPKGTLKLLGMSHSGKLSLSYLKKRLPSLEGGKAYELMCHPGYSVPEEIVDSRILSYHDWQQEFDLLRSAEAGNLCDKFGIRIIRYRDLAEIGLT